MKISLFSIFALAMLVVAACDNDSSNDKGAKKHLSDPLAKVSLDVYMMRMWGQMGEKSDCFSAKNFSLKSFPDDEITKQFIQPLKEGYEKGCAFWKSLEPVTAPVFQRVIKERTVPPSMYFFTKFEGDGEEKYSQEKIGLFDNLETCQKFETRYQGFGEGTGRCREWEDPLAFLKGLRSKKPPIAN